MAPAWTETRRSRFYIFNCFNNPTIHITECISWIIKYLLLLMHGVTMKKDSCMRWRCFEMNAVSYRVEMVVEEQSCFKLRIDWNNDLSIIQWNNKLNSTICSSRMRSCNWLHIWQIRLDWIRLDCRMEQIFLARAQFIHDRHIRFKRSQVH
jgi:hypothetical protein